MEDDQKRRKKMPNQDKFKLENDKNTFEFRMS